MSTFDFGAIEDGVARVCADAIDGTVFAAGLTAAVTDFEPQVVPLERTFLEGGLPAVTCLMGPGTHLAQPGASRLRITIDGVIWRDGVELGTSKNQLLGDLAALIDAFAGHTKAYLVAVGVQSAMFMSWSRPTPRAIAGDEDANPSHYLTLPFAVEVVAQREVSFQPA
jgi:hypothetical protein